MVGTPSFDSAPVFAEILGLIRWKFSCWQPQHNHHMLDTLTGHTFVFKAPLGWSMHFCHFKQTTRFTAACLLAKHSQLGSLCQWVCTYKWCLSCCYICGYKMTTRHTDCMRFVSSHSAKLRSSSSCVVSACKSSQQIDLKKKMPRWVRKLICF